MQKSLRVFLVFVIIQCIIISGYAEPENNTGIDTWTQGLSQVEIGFQSGIDEFTDTIDGEKTNEKIVVHTITLNESLPSESDGEDAATIENQEWNIFDLDPRYTISLPPSWSLYNSTVTSNNGTILMFQDNQKSPSFISVMAADNAMEKAFTEGEASKLELTKILNSFKEWNISPILEAGAYGTSGGASVSYMALAGNSEDKVVSSYILSDSSSFYWISVIGNNPETYKNNTPIYSEIMGTFVPHSSSDAAELWIG